MIAGSLLDLLVRSTVMIGAVWIAAAAIKRMGASAATRHLTWLLGFAAVGLLPLLTAMLPDMPLPILLVVQEPALQPVLAPTALAPPVHTVVSSSGISTSALLEIVYGAIATGFLFRPILGRVLLSRMWRDAARVDQPQALRLLDHLSHELGVGGTVRLKIASSPVVPMTWGLLRPRILVPADAAAWSFEQWRDVLLHELGHVARHDSAVRLATTVLCAFYWANPAIWLAAAAMRREQEHACDDLVLSHGAEAAMYARNLLHAARAIRSSVPALTLAAAMIRRSELEQRIVAIVGGGSRGRASRAFATAGSVVALGLASLAAVVVPVAATIPAAALPVPASLVSTTPPKYDYAPTSAEYFPATAPRRSRHSLSSVQAVRPALLEAAVAVEESPSDHYQQALVRYRAASVEYQAALSEYALKRDDYRSAMERYRLAQDRYRRDLAEYQRRQAAYDAMPDGAAPVAPVAPVVPVAPVAPVAPVVPPVPPTPPDHERS